ncbi:SapB/AmfS family lanthipeptide [Herbidospora daliensis]|nr:SapB/AmfS family lanthipeptide [Herbidospora daliensis]
MSYVLNLQGITAEAAEQSALMPSTPSLSLCFSNWSISIC